MLGQPPAALGTAGADQKASGGAGGKSSTPGTSGSTANGNEPSIGKEQQEMFEAIAKLSLQLEGERRAKARDDNFVFEMSKASALAKTLAWAEEAYKTEGDKKRKEQGDDYKGHPQGKKPDALLASLIVRLVEAIKKAGDGSIEGYVRSKLTSLSQQGQEDAVAVLYVLDGRAQQPMEIRSTRCFKIETKEDGGEMTKWIAAATRDKELETAFSTTRKFGLLSGIGVTVAEDFAPMSGAAKQVQKLVFGGAAASASGARRAKKGQS